MWMLVLERRKLVSDWGLVLVMWRERVVWMLMGRRVMRGGDGGGRGRKRRRGGIGVGVGFDGVEWRQVSCHCARISHRRMLALRMLLMVVWRRGRRPIRVILEIVHHLPPVSIPFHFSAPLLPGVGKRGSDLALRPLTYLSFLHCNAKPSISISSYSNNSKNSMGKTKALSFSHLRTRDSRSLKERNPPRSNNNGDRQRQDGGHSNWQLPAKPAHLFPQPCCLLYVWLTAHPRLHPTCMDSAARGVPAALPLLLLQFFPFSAGQGSL